MLMRLRPPALQRPCAAPTTVRASGSAPGPPYAATTSGPPAPVRRPDDRPGLRICAWPSLCGYDLRPSSARATPRRPSGPPDLRLASSRLATDEVAARHTDVGGAAH